MGFASALRLTVSGRFSLESYLGSTDDAQPLILPLTAETLLSSFLTGTAA